MYYDKYKPFLKCVALFMTYSIVALSIVSIFSLLNKVYGIGLVCVFKEVTGLYCASCGMTRATASLLRWDFYQAFRYNAFSVVLLPILFLYFYGEVYACCFNKKNFMVNKIPILFWIVLVSLMVIYGVLRNIPCFYFLVPTTIN